MTNSRDFIVTDEDYEDWLRAKRLQRGIRYGLLFSLPLWALIVWIISRLK